MAWLYCFTVIYILLSKTAFCHDDNADILQELEGKMEYIKVGQDSIRLAVQSLQGSLQEQVDKLSSSDDQGEKVTEPEDPMSNMKVKNFVDRLDKLDKNIEAIQSYVHGERETDYFLRGLRGNIGKSFDNDMLQVKKLASDMKEQLTGSLMSVDNDLNAVENFANSRNVIIGGVLYYDGIGSACGSSFDVCRVEKSECRDGKCQCAYGLSHDSLQENCVDTCKDGYGNTYQTAHNYIIRGYNDATINETTLEACKERCQAEEGFNCRSFDYFPRWNSCFLSKNVKGNAEDAWEYNSAGVHFQRDCIIDKQ